MGETHRSGGVRRCPEGVGAHVGHTRSLSGRASGSNCSGMVCAVGGAACDKATLDLLSRGEFATGECARAGDGVTSTVISGCVSFEHRQDTFGAVGSPRGNQASVVLAERLRREFTCHPSIVGFTLFWGQRCCGEK